MSDSAAARPVTRRRARRPLLSAALVCAALIILIAALTPLRAQSAVRSALADHLDAIASGDGDAYAAVAGLPASMPTLFDAEVLAAAGAGIDDYEITEIDRDGGMATATVDVIADGRTASVDFQILRMGSPWNPFAEWRVDPTASQAIAVSGFHTLPGVIVNGVEMPFADLTEDGTAVLAVDSARIVIYAALPGEYEVSAPPVPGGLVEPRTEIVEVRAGDDLVDSPRVQVGYDLTGAGRAEVRDQIDEAVRRCLAAVDDAALSCPFDSLPAYDREPTDDVEWEIDYRDGFPELIDNGAGGWTVGMATVRATPSDGGIERSTVVTGAVEITDDGSLTFRPREAPQ